MFLLEAWMWESPILRLQPAKHVEISQEVKLNSYIIYGGSVQKERESTKRQWRREGSARFNLIIR